MTDMPERVQQQLDALRQQETALADQLRTLTEQLLMTRGAIQILEVMLAPPSADKDTP